MGIALVRALLLLSGMAALSESAHSGGERDDKAVYEAVCGSCHPTSLAGGLRSEREWKETIAAMVRLGAAATEEEFARVLRYLVRTQTKVNVNSATAKEIASVLDISETSAKALVARRTEKRGFRTLEDLKEAPGVEASKIEARKDRIVFR
ncbi:MAG: helix-hairpin-helix domain-containing protein [Bryobacterales bacterium]|nr:helix-hairpin-helix domain-containing protein [Bryobacterales bacterium]